MAILIGYLMRYPAHTYISNIYMICKHILLRTYLNELELFFHTVKWFQVLLYNIHNITSVICLHTVCSIWSTDRTLSVSPTPVQWRSTPHSPKIRAWPSDGLISNPGHSMGSGGLAPLNKWSQCILQPQRTGPWFGINLSSSVSLL